MLTLPSELLSVTLELITGVALRVLEPRERLDDLLTNSARVALTATLRPVPASVGAGLSLQGTDTLLDRVYTFGQARTHSSISSISETA